MALRPLGAGLALAAITLATGCACWKHSCKPCCPPPCAAPPCCAPAAAAPCCPPGPVAAPPAPVQSFSVPAPGCTAGIGH
jgi:hypothetical protein